MKLWMGWTLGALLLCNGGAQGAEAVQPVDATLKVYPILAEKARTLVEIVVPPDQRQAMFSKVVDAYLGNSLAGIVKANPDLEQAFSENEELRKVFSAFVARQRTLVLQDLEETSPELMMAYAHAYARNFTAEELDGLIAFLSTPLGRKYAARTPELLSDPDFGAWQQDIAARAEARKDEELKGLMDEVTPIMRAKGATHHGS